MSRPDHDYLFDLASQQGGYFTAAQAHGAGLSGYLLRYHVRRRRYFRARRGLYRLRHYPRSPTEHIIEAWLAAGSDAVVSHNSALSLHDLSDVVPARVHLTVPRSQRWQVKQAKARGVQLHTVEEPLRPEEIVIRQGIRVTSPVRTIVDAAQVGTAPEQVILAIRQALQRGLTTPRALRVQAARASQRARALIERGVTEAQAA